MIKKLQIRGFGNHKKLDIDFTPGVNSIVGRNAAGKSTTIRTIKWVARNTPSGDSFINWDSKKAVVRITTDDCQVTRKKGGSKNEYFLGKKEFKAFGNNVPKEIETALGLTDINFQGQHDAPFWFSNTAGEVSRKLNSIVNLEVIDKTLADVISQINKNNTIIEITTEKKKKNKEQIKKLSYVKEANNSLIGLETLLLKQKQLEANEALLSDICKEARLHAIERKRASNQILGSQLALKMGSLQQVNQSERESLLKLIKSASSFKKEVNRKIPDIAILTSMKQTLQTNNSEKIRISSSIKNCEQQKELLCQHQKELQTYKVELEKIAGKNCPLCGAAIKK